MPRRPLARGDWQAFVADDEWFHPWRTAVHLVAHVDEANAARIASAVPDRVREELGWLIAEDQLGLVDLVAGLLDDVTLDADWRRRLRRLSEHLADARAADRRAVVTHACFASLLDGLAAEVEAVLAVLDDPFVDQAWVRVRPTMTQALAILEPGLRSSDVSTRSHAARALLARQCRARALSEEVLARIAERLPGADLERIGQLLDQASDPEMSLVDHLKLFDELLPHYARDAHESVHHLTRALRRVAPFLPEDHPLFQAGHEALRHADARVASRLGGAMRLSPPPLTPEEPPASAIERVPAGELLRRARDVDRRLWERLDDLRDLASAHRAPDDEAEVLLRDALLDEGLPVGLRRLAASALCAAASETTRGAVRGLGDHPRAVLRGWAFALRNDWAAAEADESEAIRALARWAAAPRA